MVSTEGSSSARATLSFPVAARLTAALFILAQAGCSSDNGVEQIVGPAVEPAVATSVAAIISDARSANVGSAVLPPSVIVKDQRHAGMEGVTVTFAIATGGGTVTGESVTTNSAGIARVGSWILGATPGLNTLTASVAGLPPVTFAAAGLTPPQPACIPVGVTHEFGTTSNGALGGDDCFSDGIFTDFYPTTLSGGGAYLFKLSAAFDAYLYLGTSDFYFDFERGLIADNNDESSATTNSAIKALLPPGLYMLGVSSANFGATGAYSLSSATASAEVSRCEEVYIVRGVSSSQNIQSTDCERTPGPVYADEFRIFAGAGGSPLTVSMSSTGIDSFLQLLRLDYTGVRTLVASNDNVDTSGTKDARLVYTPARGTYYVIVASTALPGQTGGYTLNVQ